MEWLAENWIFVLLVGGMGAMHLFGHGHGGHGGHKHGKAAKRETARETSPDAAADTGEPSDDA